MQNATDVKAAAAASQGCSTGVSSGGFNRRMLYIALGVGAAAGLFLGWEWLVAVGAASLIVAVAPCLVMCALGLCMSRACRNKTDVAAKTDTASTEAPVTRTAADDAPVTNTAGPANAGAETVLPEAAAKSIAAADVAVANPALEHAANAPASEARR